MDKKKLLENFDHDVELIREVLEVMKSSSAETLDKMERAIQERNSTDIAKYAHSLKGAAANFSENVFTPVAARIEHLARKQELKQIPSLFNQLKEEAEELYELVEEAIA